jgi:hypothetical protein
MIFVKQTDMPESCHDCGMLQFYEDDNSGDCYDCKALEFVGKRGTICYGFRLVEELQKHRSPKCPLQVLPYKCLEMIGDENNECTV